MQSGKTQSPKKAWYKDHSGSAKDGTSVVLVTHRDCFYIWTNLNIHLIVYFFLSFFFLDCTK